MRGKCVTLRVGVVTVSRPKRPEILSASVDLGLAIPKTPTSQASMLGLGFVKERNLLRLDWLGFSRLV